MSANGHVHAGDGEVYDSIKGAALLFLLPGLLQGIAIWFLTEQIDETTTPSLLIAIMMAVLVTPVAHFLTTTRRTRIAAAVYAAGLGLTVAGLYLLADATFGRGEGVSEPEEAVIAACAVASFLICYISAPFFRTVIEQGKRPTDYQSLFAFAWNLPVIGGAAILFTGALWIVLAIWAGLFDLIGIDFFSDLFFSAELGWPLTAGGFAIAAGIVRERESIVLALRGVLFALLKILAPILAVATALFAVAALVQGLDVLWDNWSATSLMVGAITAAVILSNAVVGEDGLPGNAVLRWSVRLQAAVLPVLAGFAVYGLWLRIGQYGLTVERIYALLIVLIAAAYALAYFISILMPKGWTFLRQANIWLAGVIFIVAVLIQTPLLNVWQWSANDQIARLKAGKVTAEEFDYAYLHFDLGRAGRQGLNRIVAMEDLPDHDTIIARVEAVREAQSRYAFANDYPPVNEAVQDAIRSGRIQAYPAGLSLPDDLLGDASGRAWYLQGCLEQDSFTCAITQTQAFASDDPQYLLFTGNGAGYINVYLLTQVNSSWEMIQNTNFDVGDKPQEQAFFNAVAAGDIEPGTITLRTFSVGGREIAFLNMSTELRQLLEVEAPDGEPAVFNDEAIESGATED